jgi:hypothetical protein
MKLKLARLALHSLPSLGKILNGATKEPRVRFLNGLTGSSLPLVCGSDATGACRFPNRKAGGSRGREPEPLGRRLVRGQLTLGEAPAGTSQRWKAAGEVPADT